MNYNSWFINVLYSDEFFLFGKKFPEERWVIWVIWLTDCESQWNHKIYLEIVKRQQISKLKRWQQLSASRKYHLIIKTVICIFGRWKDDCHRNGAANWQRSTAELCESHDGNQIRWICRIIRYGFQRRVALRCHIVVATAVVSNAKLALLTIHNVLQWNSIVEGHFSRWTMGSWLTTSHWLCRTDYVALSPTPTHWLASSSPAQPIAPRLWKLLAFKLR